MGVVFHGSALASSSNCTFLLCRCKTAVIRGGTASPSGCTFAFSSRSNWTRCELPSSTASSKREVGCCFGGRMLGLANDCNSKYVRLTPGRGNCRSLEAWNLYVSLSLSRKIARHLLLLWLLLGHVTYFRCLSIHPRSTTLLTRRSWHWRQSVTTVTTTISGTTTSFTSFSHTRTRTTLHTLAHTTRIHSYLRAASRQLRYHAEGHRPSKPLLGSASRTSSLTH